MIVAFISRTIEYVVNKLKESLPEPIPPAVLPKENGEKMGKSKRRRRRRRILRSSLSDDELSNSEYKYFCERQLVIIIFDEILVFANRRFS